MPNIFQKTSKAKAAFGKDYPKEGRYWVMLTRAKFDKHITKGSEFIAFESTVIHVLDCPRDAAGNPTVKPGEPCNFIFMDSVLGNEARLKAFLLVAAGDPGKEADDAELTPEAMEELVDPKAQPLNGVVLEIYATPQTTRANKAIIGSRAQRQVGRDEVLAACETKIVAEMKLEETLA